MRLLLLVFLSLLTSSIVLAATEQKAKSVDVAGYIKNKVKVIEDAEDLIVSMVVNGQLVGNDTPFFVIRYDNGNIAVDGDGWRALALKFSIGTDQIVEYAGIYYFELSDVHNIEYEIQDSTQRLIVNFPPEFHATQRVWNSYTADIPELTDKGVSAWLNYDLTAINRSNDSTQAGGIFKSAVAWRKYALEYSHVVNSNLSDTGDVRIATRLTRDFPESGSQLTIGDTSSNTAGGSIFRGGLNYGGIRWGSLGRSDPRYSRQPITRIEGIAEQQSVITVFEGNVPRFGYAVQPGPYSLDVPATVANNGNASFIITDILGREQLVEIPFFFNGDMVAEGTYSYNYELGKVRKNLGIENFDYGDWFAASSHSYGLSENLTITGEAQLAKGLSAIGARANFSIYPLKSAIGIATAWSESRGLGDGGLVNLSWKTKLFSPVNLNTFISYSDRDFLRTTSTTNASRPKLDGRLGLGFSTPWLNGGFNVIYTHTERWDADARKFLSATQTMRIGKTSLSFYYSTDVDDFDAYSLGMAISRSFGDHNANITQNLHPDPKTTGLTISRSATEKRIGHSVNYTTDHKDFRSWSAKVDADTDIGYGSAGLFFNEAQGAESTAATLSFAGGVGYAGGEVVAARAVAGGFAIVEAEGAEHVLVQSVGESTYTDSEGVALVRGLQPYRENPISLSSSAELDVFGSTDTHFVVPSRLGGSYVRLSASQGNAATVTLVDENNEPLPSGARVTYAGLPEPMYVSEDGYTFLTHLSSSVRATIQYGRKRWIADINFESSNDPLPDLGVIRCESATE